MKQTIIYAIIVSILMAISTYLYRTFKKLDRELA